MPQPYNYSLNATDPTDKLLEGLQVGQHIRDRKDAKALAIQAAEQKAELNEAISALGPNATPQDYMNIANKMVPEDAEKIRKNWDLLDKVKQRNHLLFSVQLMAAFDVDPEIAIDLLNERAEASRNSNEPKMTKAYEDWAKLGKLDPDAVRHSIGSLVAVLDNSGEVLEDLAKHTESLRKDELQPMEMGKLETEVEQMEEDLKQNKLTNPIEFKKKKEELRGMYAENMRALLLHPMEMDKLDAEIDKIKAEIQSEIAATGLAAKDKKFDREKKIRDEYTKRTANSLDAKSQYDKVLISGARVSGPGDVAMIFAFMKMLDPGSVVRESEFARAEDTGGLYTKLSLLYVKATKGELLEDWQRAEFTELAGQYYAASVEHENKVRSNLTNTIEEYGLTAKNIFPEEIEKGDSNANPEAANYKRHATGGE